MVLMPGLCLCALALASANWPGWLADAPVRGGGYRGPTAASRRQVAGDPLLADRRPCGGARLHGANTRRRRACHRDLPSRATRPARAASGAVIGRSVGGSLAARSRTVPRPHGG